MLAWLHAGATRLNADQLDFRDIGEGMEDANGVTATANAGEDHIWQASLLLHNLFACLTTDHGLEVAHDTRLWIGSSRSTRRVELRIHIPRAVTDRLVNGILYCIGAPLYR